MTTLSHAPVKAALIAALLAGLLVTARPAHAAAAGDGDKPAEARPLPKFYDQLDLTDEQKEKIFKTLDKFGPLIEGQLEMTKATKAGGNLVEIVSAMRVLNALKANQRNALHKILNEDQLDKLLQLQAADAPPKP